MAAVTERSFEAVMDNQDMPSRIDRSKMLSYDRWGVSLICSANTCNDFCEYPFPSQLLMMVGHTRLVIERVLPELGYELLDVDLLPLPEKWGGKYYNNGLHDAMVRIFRDPDKTLAIMTSSTGVLIKSHEKIQAIIDYVTDKKSRSDEYVRQRSVGLSPVTELLFTMEDPDPTQNVFTCTTFALEACKAGGVDLYLLFGDSTIIPTMDIIPLKELVDRAVRKGYPLTPEIEAYINDFEHESKTRQKDMHRTVVEMKIIAEQGPFVLARYLKLERERSLPADSIDFRLIEEAERQLIATAPWGSWINDALSMSLKIPMFLTIPFAAIVNYVFEQSVLKKCSKKAMVQYFQQE